MNNALSSDHYDVIIVGARPAGTATALLLARQGLRVAIVDRGRYGADTLSTHALMRAGVLQLARLGVLARVIEAGTPPVRSATFTYANETQQVPIKARDGLDALYAPRRTVLDRALVDAARVAGIEVGFSTTLVDLVKTADGRVGGIVARGEDGGLTSVKARLVVGADGMRSTVAKLAAAEITRTGSGTTANVYGYWSNVPVDGYHWFFDNGVSAGAIPTNDGFTCIFASVPTSRFEETFREDVEAGYRHVLSLAAPRLSARLAGGHLAERLRGIPGQPGFLRRAAGPGWALVGDAGYFKDPTTAHGITDALVDAEYLARAIGRGTGAALEEYALERDRRAEVVFGVTDRIATFAWTLDEVRALHKQLAAAMSDEVTALRELTQETAFA
ncbi:MAG TPA: NAD(P)/FAD-dependent oxidoreductase [Vicinamibacterales bacterium]|nr:NAD(P)/FAD-dependent oxidoreductase [Vicinamibacterales bacterium]